MIYDRVLTVHDQADAGSPLLRRLKPGVSYYYAEREVYGSSYYRAKQAGEKISMMVELPRAEGEDRITADQYCIPEDGRIYKVVQAQYGTDGDGLPITTLSLERSEGKYEILRP